MNLKVASPVQRHNFFIQANDSIFQQDPFPASVDTPPEVEDLLLRHERQTLVRLPKSKAVLFTVHTFFTPVTDLEREPESLRDLLNSARAMPEEMAKYKCRHVWMETLERYAETILTDDVRGEGDRWGDNGVETSKVE